MLPDFIIYDSKLISQALFPLLVIEILSALPNYLFKIITLTISDVVGHLMSITTLGPLQVQLDIPTHDFVSSLLDTLQGLRELHKISMPGLEMNNIHN
jgi:hypothetical protein